MITTERRNLPGRMPGLTIPDRSHSSARIPWILLDDVQDTGPTTPEFMDYFNKLVGKCVNASMGRWELLWSFEPTCAVRLETPDGVIDNLCCVLPTLRAWSSHTRSGPEPSAGLAPAPVLLSRCSAPGCSSARMVRCPRH